MEQSVTGNSTGKPRLAVFIATAAGLGLLPKAPGTIGSLGGLALAGVLRLILVNRGFSYPEIVVSGLLFLIVGTFIGIWAIRQVEGFWQSHDDQRIVIDEVLGQAIPLFILPIHQISHFLISFLLFRILDITKPGPIGWADRLPGPWGTLLDDLIAGALAALIAWPLLSYF